MQCRDVRELGDSFLSEELLTETNHEILRHLDTCPACRAEIDSRRALRASLRGAFDRAAALKPDAAFERRLRETLRDAAAQEQRSGSALRRWLALAAALLIVVGAAGAAAARSRIAIGALARDAAGDHRNCALHFTLAERPVALTEAAQRYDATYRVLQTFPPVEVATASGVARVLERHSCEYGGRRFAHIVLRYRGAVVSLVVTARDARSPVRWADLITPARRDSRFGDLSVISLRTGGHLIAVVGDLGQPELATLADAIAGPLAAQLAGA